MPLTLTLPTIGGDNGSWGGKLNTALGAVQAFVNALETSVGAAVLRAGDTMSGLLGLKTVTQAHVHVASAANTSLDLSAADSFDTTIAGATTIAFTNVPAGANTLVGFILRLVNGGSATVTWPASVKWPGGAAPAFTAAGVDVLVFLTDDAGTSWRGAVAMTDVK